MQNTPITNSDTLQAWLKTRPQADSIAIAHRSALRVLPESYAHRVQSKDSEFELLLLQFLRVTLLAAIRPETLTPEFRQMAAAASNPIFKAAKRTPIEDNTYYITYSMITYGILPAASYASVIAAASSFDSVYAGKVWTALDRDAAALQTGRDPFTLPLWHGETPPEWFTATSAAMRNSWQTENPTHWAFWLRWYDAAIAGRPLDWQLQHAIALIPDDIWQSGPGPVAEAIAKIEAAHEIDRKIKENPYAWHITFDRTTQTFSAQPVRPRDLSEIIKSVTDSLNFLHRRCRDIKQGNFGEIVKYAFAPVVRDLKADLKVHATSPLSLFKAIEGARREFETISHTERYGPESFLVRFFAALASHAEDICVAAPEVVAQLKAKEAVRYELYSLAQKQSAMQFALGLHVDAEGILKRVALESLLIIQDDKRSESDKKEAWYFAKAVLPRAARAYMVEMAEADGKDALPAVKSRMQRMKDVADALSSADKGIDALQENVPELADWVQELIKHYGQSGGF